MNTKQAKRLYNYILDTQSSTCPNIYIIQLIDANDEITPVLNIKHIVDSGYQFVLSKEESVYTLWDYEIEASEIYVFKSINWNNL